METSKSLELQNCAGKEIIDSTTAEIDKLGEKIGQSKDNKICIYKGKFFNHCQNFVGF